MIHASWDRWITSSLYQHFDDPPKILFCEGDELPDADSWAELRLLGPRYHEISKDYFRVRVDINISCSVKLGSNSYSINDLVGFYVSKCTKSIDIFKNVDTDPAELLGCLRMRDEPVDVIPFGCVLVGNDKLLVMNTSIDAFYEMDLTWQ